MYSPTIIPNLWCNWYISGGPQHQTIEIGKPPQIQSGTCPPKSSMVGFFSQPTMTCPACSK